MDLREIAEQYSACHDISDGHYCQLMQHARQYSGGLSAEAINADLLRLRRLGRSSAHVRNRRAYILLLWRFAASRDIVPDPPMSKIMRVRLGDVVPRGYSVDEVAQLVEAARLLRGVYSSGITRAGWWTSYISAAWDTGLSTCDVLKIERGWIGQDNAIVTVRRKTGRRVAVALYDSTLTAIDATFPPDRQLIWPLTISREMMRRTFGAIAASCGLGGTLKWLRSGSGTSVEDLLGHGEQHLGNTRQVFERHYYVRSLRPRLPAEIRCTATARQ